MRKDRSKIILAIGVLLILVSVLVYWKPWERFLLDDETKAWRLTLVGKNGAEKVLSIRDLTGLPSYKGKGGFFSTVGVVTGPYKYEGVTLEELGKQVGGISPGDAVMISARDGYSAVLVYEQVMGEFVTYDTDLKEVPHEELKTVLVYREEGKPLRHYGGKPLRLAILGPGQGFLTEGAHWVKWIEKIEVMGIP